MINKHILAKHFSQNAQNYDNYAQIQKQMANILLELIKSSYPELKRHKSVFTDFEIDSGDRGLNILDIGCGTGFFTGLLCETFNNASIKALDIAPGMLDVAKKRLKNNKNISFICGDIEAISFDERFDLIVSNATFQWLNDLEGVLRKLLNQGLRQRDDSLASLKFMKQENRPFVLPSLCFSTFGEQTFRELYMSYKKAKEHLGIDDADILPGQSFLSLNQLKDVCYNVMENAAEKFHIRTKELIKTFEFDTVRDFLDSVKKLGANNSSVKKHPKSLAIVKEMMRIYEEEYSVNGKVQATYHCIFIAMGELL